MADCFVLANPRIENGQVKFDSVSLRYGNVNPDFYILPIKITWDYIANKPLLGSASRYDYTYFATSLQGSKADTAVQGIIGGTNITIDNTDPLHPKINSSAGSGGFINPMTTLGDIIYQSTLLPTRLAGNTTTNKMFLAQIGTGTASNPPAWSIITQTDVGLGNVNNTSDLNKPISNATQTALNLKANSASLATVATSGSYSDLINKPTIPAAQINTDWNASSGVAQLINKPSFNTINGSSILGSTNLITPNIYNSSGVANGSYQNDLNLANTYKFITRYGSVLFNEQTSNNVILIDSGIGNGVRINSSRTSTNGAFELSNSSNNSNAMCGIKLYNDTAALITQIMLGSSTHFLDPGALLIDQLTGNINIGSRTGNTNISSGGIGPANTKLRVFNNGNIGIGTNPTDNTVDKLQVGGSVLSTQYKLSALNTKPASGTDTGTTGEIRVDQNYIYVATGTNTWKKTSLSWNDPFVNVMDYGAVGDGVTENKPFFDAAVAANPGKSLYVPTGTFLLTGWYMPVNIGLYGNGPTSQLKVASNARCVNINQNCIIRNIDFYGSGAGAGMPFQTGIFTYNNTGGATLVTGWSIESCNFYNFSGNAGPNGGAGIYVVAIVNGASEGGRITNVRGTNNNCFISLDDRGEYITITNVKASSNNIGMSIGAGNITVTGADIQQNNIGIKMYNGGSGNSGHGVFSSVTCNHNTTYNLSIDGLTIGHTFSGCDIYDANSIISNSTGIKFIGCDIAGQNSYTFTLQNTAKTLRVGCRAPLLPNSAAMTVVILNGETTKSNESVATVTGTTSSVALGCTAVTGATQYKWYRGTTSGGENVYFTSATNSFTDVGSAGTAGTPPVTNATQMTPPSSLTNTPSSSGGTLAAGTYYYVVTAVGPSGENFTDANCLNF